VAFRYWLSGPRILKDWSGRELASTQRTLLGAAPLPSPRARSSPSFSALMERSSSMLAPPMNQTVQFALVVWFDHPDASANVMTGANVRLRKHIDADGWVTGLSVGQVVAAVKSEANALGHKYTLARPADIEAATAAQAEKNRKAWTALKVALIAAAIFVAFVALIMGTSRN
jgi:hypothetical protein